MYKHYCKLILNSGLSGEATKRSNPSKQESRIMSPISNIINNTEMGFDWHLLSLNWRVDAFHRVKPSECLSSWSLTQCWWGNKPLADSISPVCVFYTHTSVCVLMCESIKWITSPTLPSWKTPLNTLLPYNYLDHLLQTYSRLEPYHTLQHCGFGFSFHYTLMLSISLISCLYN